MMFIVLHCGGMPFNGETIKTESLGGSESAAYYVSRGLASRGHKVTLFTNHPGEGIWDGVRYCYSGETSAEFPMGDRFTYYGGNTPIDVLIMQRHPLAFRMPWSAKIKLWWLHDLAIKRLGETVSHMLWNLDGILSVSEWHSNQIIETWKVPKNIIMPIANGIDLDLWPLDDAQRERGQALLDAAGAQPGELPLLYAARPERGLDNLVDPGGIMDRLAKRGTKHRLYVCGYENTVPQMVDLYGYLGACIDAAPNCAHIGALNKQQLADVESVCHAYVYPTAFEDTSCIMAMESSAAGLPFLCSDTAALPETTAAGGAVIVPLKKGAVSHGAWVSAITKLGTIRTFGTKGFSNKHRDGLVGAQLAKAPEYAWNKVVDTLEGRIAECFKRAQPSRAGVMRHLLRMSDYYALDQLPESDEAGEIDEIGAIEQGVLDEAEECYAFVRNDTWGKHYAGYYEYERERGVEYGPESLENNLRFNHVRGIVGDFPPGARVLDYGCAHGHYTVNLAKAYPGFEFIGIDLAESNIAIARKWAADEGISNVTFVHADLTETEPASLGIDIGLFDCIIAAEVLEHVAEPWSLADRLGDYAAPGGLFVLTTPFGPWEAEGFRKHHPWRAHVHHFERADLHDVWGHFPGFAITCVPSGQNAASEVMGSYVTRYRHHPDFKAGRIDYDRKFAQTVPRQTVSLCLIVKDGEQTLKRSLDGIRNVADQVVIGVDETTTDRTREVIADFQVDNPLWPVVETFEIESPLVTGFDVARNATLERASGDWILWVDHDEIVVHSANIHKYLRSNSFQSYAVKQHHFAIEPLGVLKTDIPARLFRNRFGVQFYGVVHEHPETSLNNGIGPSMLIPDVEIAHEGYTTNEVRRGRFDRNIELMVRDREKNPDRKLGKFLWIRDLAQMCSHEAAEKGMGVTPAMRERAATGLKLWEELLAEGEIRMLLDGMEYYSMLAGIAGAKFEMGFVFDMVAPYGEHTHLDNGARRFSAKFAKLEHAQGLIKSLVDQRAIDYESKYF